MYGHYLRIPMPSLELFRVCLCLMHYKNAKQGDSIRLKVSKIAKSVPWFLADVHKGGLTFNKYNNSLKDTILNQCFLKKNHR